MTEVLWGSLGGGGWSPESTDKSPWLQVDLQDRMEVTAVATQGRHDSTDWVSAYMLLYSDTGRVWKQYMLEDNVGVGVRVLVPFHPAHFAEIAVCALSHLLHGCLSYK